MFRQTGLSRRAVLKGSGAMVAAGVLGGVAGVGVPGRASAATDGFGLRIVEHQTSGRMEYYRFHTDAIAWDPAVNVLLPDDYSSGRTYPVLYLLHGGNQDFREFDTDLHIRDVTAGKPLIVVMPDGGRAGWYSDPVSTNAGPHDWETFHISQLVPWVDANFRTYAEYDGRAVSGFSMGGFGALKYAARHAGQFASVSAHSGPASLRRDAGTVVHWANASSAAVDLAGGTVYGVPLWDQRRVSADNPVEHVESYRDKRIFLVAGTDTTDPNEHFVLPGQREFRGLLQSTGIPFTAYEEPGGHFVRPARLAEDIDGVVARLKKA